MLNLFKNLEEKNQKNTNNKNTIGDIGDFDKNTPLTVLLADGELHQFSEKMLDDLKSELKNYLVFPELLFYPVFESQRNECAKHIKNASLLLDSLKKSKAPLLTKNNNIVFVGIKKPVLSSRQDGGCDKTIAVDSVVHLGMVEKEDVLNIESADNIGFYSSAFCYFTGSKNVDFQAQKINLTAEIASETGVTCKKCLKRMETIFKIEKVA